MFWPSPDDSVVDAAQVTGHMFGMNPDMPDLAISEDVNVSLTGSLTEMTSFIMYETCSLPGEFNQSGRACHQAMTLPVLQEVALRRHLGHVG